MKIRRLALAAGAAAVTLMMPATALASAGAAPQTASTANPAGGPSFNAKDAKCSHVTKPTGATQSCTQVQQLPLKDLTPAQLAERQRAMSQIAARSKSRPAISAQPAATAPAQCNFSSTEFAQTGVSNPSRFVSCSDVLWTTSVWLIVDGVPEPQGFFFFEDQSWNLYSVSSLSWTHGMQTIGYLTGASGVLAEGVSGFLNSNCLVAADCDATSLTGPDVQVVDLFPGGTFSFEWNESDIGPASRTPGSTDDLTPSLGVDWLITTEGLGEAVETGDLAGRCDSTISNSSGCVDNGFIPTLFLSLMTYGAGAAIVQFAQTMSAHWGQQGVGSPLRYLKDPIVVNNNREIICDATFINLGTAIGGDYGDKDSCDEFPFAATYESGANTVTPGGSGCAQVTAVEGSPGAATEALAWNSVTPLVTPTLNEPCVRGHIPFNQNGLPGVGGAYGRFVTSQRLVDLGGGAGDPFWVAVTA